MDIVDRIFGPTGHITWTQECARAAIIFAYGLVAVRLAGRRVFGQSTALDIIVAIVTGSTLSRALTGNADLVGTLAATTLLMLLHWGLAQLAARHAGVSRWVEGPPVALGEGGRVHSEQLLRHGISPVALEQALRSAGLADAAQARLIVLEPSGRISVVKEH